MPIPPTRWGSPEKHLWRVKADLVIPTAASRPHPPVASVAVVVGFPNRYAGLPVDAPRVLCPVLAMVLLTA